jgi:hypothetical protein
MNCTFRAPLEHGEGHVTVEIYQEDGRMVCGVYQLYGRLDEPPKQWLRTLRAELSKLETIARNAGCEEMRIAGRDWSRVFPDYTPFDGVRNGLRKAL